MTMSWTLSFRSARLMCTLGIIGIFLKRKNIIIILMSDRVDLLAVQYQYGGLSTFLGDIAPRPGIRMLVLTVAAAKPRSGLAVAGGVTFAIAARARWERGSKMRKGERHDSGKAGNGAREAMGG